MPSWCSKDPVTSEPLLVKDECQWQEENQEDPSLMQQALDVGGKCEVFRRPTGSLGSSERLCVPSWARYT